jgi:hypothetical protein
VRRPRYLTKYQRKEMDIALWDALLDYIDEERYDHMWTHLERGNVLELWKILDGKAASEPEEYCTALKDRIKEKKFDDGDIKTVEHFGRWFADAVGNYDQLTLSAKNTLLPPGFSLTNLECLMVSSLGCPSRLTPCRPL